MNIYRIIQESVNNALKYAEAASISVRIDKDDSQYSVAITDDGLGFNVNDEKDGNGLQNIKKRAKDLNGSVKIHSEVGKGTSVRVQFPV
jgi:signal transduction histidine kinase